MAGSNAGRAWRRFRRRPAVVQVGAGVVVVAVVIGIVVAVASGGGGKSTGETVAASPTTAAAAATTVPFAQVPPSTRGITPTSIEVVFPVANLNALSDQIGFAGDPEFPEQPQAINFFVKEINDAGGINGRQIHASIVPYDPTNAAASRALCKDWTEGTPGAFAVIDGLGTVAGDEQLCVTQEGSTPLLSAWTTVTDWTTKGAPYLWWLGPDQSAILQALVTWGQGAGLLGGSNKVGIVVSDQADDQAALNNYLLPDLRKAGVTDPVVETLPGNPSDSASTAAQAPLVVQRLKAAGVQSLIPLIPFNAFFPELQAQTQQSWFPHLLLSDYQSSVNTGLGLLPVPYEKALDGQEGITAETLGASDDARPQSQGGYNAGVRSCYTDWVKAFPQT
ncbi:MAG TPA: ABC transporter substrate-binding protein, partial [Acidimicrobiales bacterium]|nr:ABC transporter substrate-binding protein [Acidimicrobiales bacterium]